MADEHDDSVDELLRLFDQDPVSHEASLIEALALASAQKWLQAAESVNTLVRCAAAAAAIGSDEHDVLIYLPKLLTDPSPLVRKAVLNGPGVGGLLPAATIASALGEESWEIRVAAVRAAGAVGSMDHQLREVMRQDEDEDVRRAAAEELVGRADEATLLEICQLIKHETGNHWELEDVVRVLVDRLDSAGPGFISRNRPFLVEVVPQEVV